MSFLGQKCGTCDHIMAILEGHLKCARCRNQEVGQDLCLQTKDFLSANHLLLNRNYNKTPLHTYCYPSLVDYKDCKLREGKGGRVVEETPAGKKKLLQTHLKSARRKPASQL